MLVSFRNFTITRQADVDLLKLSHAGTLKKSKPRVVKSELHKQQCNVTLFDCNHLAHVHVMVLWQMQKFMCYCTVFTLTYFEFEGNFQVQAPRGLYLEGLIF